MNLTTIFALSNLTVMPVWALMILLPRWRVTERIVGSPLVALLPALIYAALVLPSFGAIFAAVSNPALPEIVQLLGTPQGATIAWAHFLAFDLLTGRWAYLDSRDQGMSPLIMAPILFMILMLGPIGFLIYLAARAVAGRVRTPAVQRTPSLG
jgi:apolipoprotein N-acyltransferase